MVNFTRGRVLARAATCIAFFALAAEFGLARMTWTTPLSNATWFDIARGTAPTPFQYRLLVPTIQYELWRALGSTGESLIQFTTEVGFHFAFLVVLWLWLRRLTNDEPAAIILTCFGSLITHVLLTAGPLPFLMPYDSAGLVAITAGLWALSEGRWGWFYPIFIAGTFNRETTLLLAVVTTVAPLRNRVQHGMAQLAIWCAIKAALWLNFAHSRGAGLFEITHGERPDAMTHLSTNLSTLSSWEGLALLGSVLGGLILPIVLYWKRISNPVVARFWFVAGAYFAVLIVIGNLEEIRLYAEFAGVAVASAALLMRTSEQVRLGSRVAGGQAESVRVTRAA